MIVKAIKDSGQVEITMQTSSKKNTRDPSWNEKLSFGCGYWKYIKISVKDRDDIGKDDTLLPEKVFVICEEDDPVCLEEYVIGNKGMLNFEIRYRSRADGNDCDPNPCFNGGTCKEHVHTCSQYQCTCPSGYTSKNCERESDGGDGGGSPGGGPQPIDVNGPSYDGFDEGFFNNN